jgi:hypothetical protein
MKPPQGVNSLCRNVGDRPRVHSCVPTTPVYVLLHLSRVFADTRPAQACSHPGALSERRQHWKLSMVIPLCGNRLVGVVSLAVGEEVVDEHADDGEEEDNQGPEDLVGHGAV